jgi:hypothetical protein
MAQVANHVELKPETIQGFEVYVQKAEAAMEERLKGSGPFLWCEQEAERVRRVREGEVVTQRWTGRGPGRVPRGLIHDWIGAAFVAGASMAELLALIQNYDNHKNIYQPEVMDSKLIERNGNDFRIYLRLLKKKIITVVLDTEHEVHYRALSKPRWECRSRTTRITEVENPGTPPEKALAPDTGYGFLWRLHSYWRFEDRDGGVYVECRAISLTRDIPFGLGWAIEPIIQELPKESLSNTLEATRRALQTRTKATASP